MEKCRIGLKFKKVIINMSEKTSLAKNRSQSFSDFKQVNSVPSVTISRENLNPPPQEPKNNELSNKKKQETMKNLVITKLIIQSSQKSQRILSKNTKSVKTLNKLEDNPFFKFLSDDTINYSTLSEAEKLKHSENIYKEHLRQTFYSLKIVKNLQKYSQFSLKSNVIRIPCRFPGRKTLVFDLDETLIHCMGQRQGQVEITVKFPDKKDCKAWINLRPYLKECLEQASQDFEVIIFTASHQLYADSVINYLDPENKYFHHRLYRDSCVKYWNFNIKDLRLIDRRLQDIVIVDNSVFSFAFQLDNGVPIIPWINDPLDTELLRLIEYLKVVKDVDDVREFNRKLFQLDTFYDDYVEDYPKHNDLGK